MTPLILSCLLVPGLIFPFQIGRWCLRHGRAGSGWAMFVLIMLAVGVLAFAVYREMRT